MLRRHSLRTPVVFLFGSVAIALLYLAMPPYELASSTYVAAAVLLAGMAIVTFNTVSKAPSGSLGQILYETDNPQSVLVPAKAHRKTSRGSRW